MAFTCPLTRRCGWQSLRLAALCWRSQSLRFPQRRLTHPATRRDLRKLNGDRDVRVKHSDRQGRSTTNRPAVRPPRYPNRWRKRSWRDHLYRTFCAAGDQWQGQAKIRELTVERSEFDKRGNGIGFGGAARVPITSGRFNYSPPTLHSPTTGFRFRARARGSLCFEQLQVEALTDVRERAPKRPGRQTQMPDEHGDHARLAGAARGCQEDHLRKLLPPASSGVSVKTGRVFEFRSSALQP